MYFSIGIVLFAVLLSVVVFTGRKRAAIKKICAMTLSEKCDVLDDLISPFGYCYDRCQDIITSRNDAWQREFGYNALFDRAASHLNMVFDWLPIYFDYDGRTWLLELWKGQYGINSGAEIGLYCADGIVPPEKRGIAHFDSVSDSNMLSMAFCLTKDGHMLASVSKRTWWLTAFSMGKFSKPRELFLSASITFRDAEMLHAFLKALQEIDLPKECIHVCGLQVHLLFGGYIERHFSPFARFFRCMSQFFNRIYCRLYLFVTRFFVLTIDRLLYLFYLLPGCFRRCLRLRRCRRKRRCLRRRYSDC